MTATVAVRVHVGMWARVCAQTTGVAFVPGSCSGDRYPALLHVEQTTTGELASGHAFRHAEVVCECEEVEGVAESDDPFEDGCGGIVR